jgi:hypothetical protein
MSFREIAVIFTLIFIAYAVFRLWKAFNSPDGERYLKRRTQGPFVPVMPEATTSDAARKP